MNPSLLRTSGSQTRRQAGFTLIEILMALLLIAILATIVIIAINPAKQFAQARNTQRTSNVESILNAVGQRIADAEIERVDAELRCQHVQHLFLRHHRLRHAEAAEGAGRRAVGEEGFAQLAGGDFRQHLAQTTTRFGGDAGGGDRDDANGQGERAPGEWAQACMRCVERPSPNYNARQAPVTMIVLHYTGMETGAAAVARTEPSAAMTATTTNVTFASGACMFFSSFAT